MKTITRFNLLIAIIFYANFITCMESGLECRYAIDNDADALVKLINKKASKDSDKIVVVPKLFRKQYIQSAVDAKRLFVACKGATIVGYKKLYCVTDQNECIDILENELRCKEDALDTCQFISLQDHSAQESIFQKSAKIGDSQVTYIYSGADFTHPDYRSKRINTSLTNFAFRALQGATIENINNKSASHIALLFGLTNFNAGRQLLDGRVEGIIKQFVSFAQEISDKLTYKRSSCIIASRYHAFKPSFNPQAIECIPLSDNQAVPGYGYQITYPLKERA